MSGHHHHDHHAVGGGAAVLDIGGDVGALLALMDADAEGTELHVRLTGSTNTVHTGVWTRHRGQEHVTAALFCELSEGRYWVLDPDGRERIDVDVKGGELAELDLRR
jgi:hypothetical protein